MNNTGRFYNDGRCMRSASEALAVFERAHRAALARRGGEIVEQEIGLVRPTIASPATPGTFRVGGRFACNGRMVNA